MFTRKMRKGFTLVELIIIMVVIGILGAVVYSKFGNTTDDAKYAKELSQITSLKASIEALNAKSRIFDITTTNKNDELIKGKLDKKLSGLKYSFASVKNGNLSAQSLVGFGVDESSISHLKTIVADLESVYDVTASATAGKFQYDISDCSITDGSKCYYIVYLDGTITSSAETVVGKSDWIPTIGTGAGELNAATTTSTVAATQTFVKLN